MPSCPLVDAQRFTDCSATSSSFLPQKGSLCRDQLLGLLRPSRLGSRRLPHLGAVPLRRRRLRRRQSKKSRNSSLTSQKLLREVRAEHEIEGHRVTPGWYLRYAVADAYILAIHAFAEQFPKLLNDYCMGAALAYLSSDVKAGAGAQALQALAKADLVVGTITQVLQELESFRLGHDPLPTNEIEGLPDRVRGCRSLVLERIAEAVTELRPELSKSAPDLFGEAWFTLIHHTE